MCKLFLVVRRDLSPGQQAVQACHALKEFNVMHPEKDKLWYEMSNTLALLEVNDEPALEKLLEKALWRGVAVSSFREPDRQNELTALALGPEGRRLCQGLPLALR
jgi:peptidyl-tRNA hydrolase